MGTMTSARPIFAGLSRSEQKLQRVATSFFALTFEHNQVYRRCDVLVVILLPASNLQGCHDTDCTARDLGRGKDFFVNESALGEVDGLVGPVAHIHTTVAAATSSCAVAMLVYSSLFRLTRT